MGSTILVTSISDQVRQTTKVIKGSHELTWLNRVGWLFTFKPHYANANHLSQAEAVLVVLMQFGCTRMPLSVSLHHSTQLFIL